jgi:hypothetical protein
MLQDVRGMNGAGCCGLVQASIVEAMLWQLWGADGCSE